jgi:hypothetical protein
MRVLTEEQYQKLVTEMNFLTEKGKEDFAKGIALVLGRLKKLGE